YQGEGAAPSPMPAALKTVVRIGTTIGAGALIGPGVDIGPWAMVGMGAVVTRDVLPHALMVGAPARVAGWVCVCGTPLGAAAVAEAPATAPHEEEAHALPDAPRAPLRVAPREPVGDVAELLLDLGLEPGLLAHLAHRRRHGRLAGLDVPLGDGPHQGPALGV